MNYEKACNILDINQKDATLDECVKKAYFRMALRYHPDKYKEDNGEKFKEIKLAYDFLTENKRNTRGFDYVNIDENIDYKELIKMCINYFSPETNWDNLFVDTSFQGIMKDCQSVSFKIFDKLNKNKAKQVYDFLYKFKFVLGIEDELLNSF